MPESAAQLSLRLAALAGSERLLLVTPGRHGDAILRDLLTSGLKDHRGQITILDASRERLISGQSVASKVSRRIQGRATRLPFRRHSFDAVLSFESLYSIRPPWTVLAELHRVLEPDGKLVLLEPAKHGVFSTLRDKLTGPGKRIYPLTEIKNRMNRADYTVERLEESSQVANMSWPSYCICARKRENPVEPAPNFTTAREMMEKRQNKTQS